MAFLTADKTVTLNGVAVNEKIIPNGTKWKNGNKAKKAGFSEGALFKANIKLSNGSGKVQGITVHNTAKVSISAQTTQAEQYTRATYNENMGSTRVHFYVDDKGAWQNLALNEVGWHAGDGTYGQGNNTTIALELIMNATDDAYNKAVEDNGARLIAYLLHSNNLDIEKLYTHTHFINKGLKLSGNQDYMNTYKHSKAPKYCPAYILPHWNKFKALVEKYLVELTAPTAEAPKKTSQNNGNNSSLKVGDLVRINAAATYYTGKTIPAWVKAQKWYIDSIKGDRAVINKSESGKNAINSPVSIKFLSTAKTVVPAPVVKEIKIGSTVKVNKGAKTYTGGGLASFVYTRNHKVSEIKGDRAVITYGGVVVAAVKLSDLMLVS